MNNLNEKIQREVIDKHIYKDVKDTSHSTYFWRKLSNGFEAFGKVLLATQGVVSFASASYNYPMLGFVSGSMTIIAMSCISFSKYAVGESKERQEQMNEILKFKQLSPLPVIASSNIQGNEIEEGKDQPEKDKIKIISDKLKSESKLSSTYLQVEKNDFQEKELSD